MAAMASGRKPPANPIAVGAGFTITLDAQGNADAVFIFQMDSAITTGTNSIVVLANGAQAKNVRWKAGSAATLGVSSIFKGTVIANGAAGQGFGRTPWSGRRWKADCFHPLPRLTWMRLQLLLCP